MLSMDGLGQKLMRGSGAVLLFKVGGALAGYGFAWQVAAAGGAAAYGRFEWAVTVLMVAAMVGRLGLDGAAVQLIAGWEAQGLRARVAPFFRWGSGVVVAVSGAIGAAMYLALEAPEGWGWGWAGLCLGVPLFAWTGWLAEVLRGQHRMVPFSLLQQGTVVGGAWLLFAGLPAVDLPPAEWALFAFLAAGALLGAGGWWALRRQREAAAVPADPREAAAEPGGWPGWRAAGVGDIAGPMWMSGVAFLAMSSTDTLLLEAWESDAGVGVYRLALRLAAFITFTQFAINAMATPMFRALHVRGDRADLQRLLGQISTANLLLSTPILLVLLLFPDPLLALFGEEFAAPEVRGLLAVLGVAQWINANCGPVLNLMNMTGLQRAANRVILATAVLNLLLNLWWIPRWGLQGAAWATAVSTVVWNGVSVVWIRKNLGVWTILGWAGRGR
ncbi:MAG: hypothetical protein RJA19_1877 [Bacteroidota bacterium]